MAVVRPCLLRHPFVLYRRTIAPARERERERERQRQRQRYTHTYLIYLLESINLKLPPPYNKFYPSIVQGCCVRLKQVYYVMRALLKVNEISLPCWPDWRLAVERAAWFGVVRFTRTSSLTSARFQPLGVFRKRWMVRYGNTVFRRESEEGVERADERVSTMKSIWPRWFNSSWYV